MDRIANVLLDLDITPGVRVAFLAKNTTRYFEILFGVNKAGAALLPLNWRLAAALTPCPACVHIK